MTGRTDDGLREPTPDMRIAGGTAWAEALKTAGTYVDCADACWKAMWDARPSAPVQSGAATSPAKPDREALIHTICPHIRQYSDSHWQGNHACLQCPATVKISQGDAVQRCRRDAEEAADDVIRCWQSTGDQPTPQVNGASTPAVASGHSMSRWLDELGYRMCWHPGWLAGLWARVWYRYRCPYPITKDHSARACVRAGYCGCDNGPRLSHLLQERSTPEAT